MDANLFQQRRGGGNEKSVGILSGFLQLSQAGVADLGMGGIQRVTPCRRIGASAWKKLVLGLGRTAGCPKADAQVSPCISLERLNLVLWP